MGWAQNSPEKANRFTPPTASPILETISLDALLEKTRAYPIDLQLVARLAETQNLTVASSGSAVKAIKARLRQTQAALLPNIGASYVQSRFQGGLQIGGETVAIYRTTVQPLVEVNWTVQGAQSIFQILAAKRRLNSAQQAFNLTTQQQVSAAVQAYYNLLGAYQQKAVAKQTVDSIKRQVEVEEARLKVGVGTRLEVARARALLAQQQQLYIQADTTIGVAEQQLLEALNLDRNIHLLPNETEAFQRGLLQNDPSLESLITYAKQNNPGLRQVDQNRLALKNDVRQAWGALLPSVTLRAYVSGTGNTLDNLQLGRFAGLSANANLLTKMGFQAAQQVRERRALAEQAGFEQQALARRLETLTTAAYLNSVNGKGLIESADVGAQQAELALRIALGRYQSGVGTDLDVVTAQVALQSAKSAQVQAVINYNVAQVQLLEALGAISTESVQKGVRINGS